MKVLKIDRLYSFLHMYNTLHLVQLYTNIQTEVLSSTPPLKKVKSSEVLMIIWPLYKMTI